MKKLKLLDLFSGIGGFSLGLESTGFFETIAFVEKDKFCQKVLRKNFNNIPIEEDIRNVKGSKYKADVITGGFPCQPFSIAGKRKGTDDDRYLWDETIRDVRECKPKWFIGENVEGIINIQEGLVLRQVQDDLEKEGFQVQCLIIPASGIGAWHQRKRVWIMAHSYSNRYRDEIRRSSGEEKKLSEEYRKENSSTRKSSGTSTVWRTGNTHVSNSNTGFSIRKNEEIQTRGNTFNNGSSSDVPNSSSEGLQGHDCKQQSSEQKLGLSTNKNNEGIKTWWETQSKLCGVPNGLSYELDKDRASRIKSLGNSIVPQIARQLGLAIMEAEND